MDKLFILILASFGTRCVRKTEKKPLKFNENVSNTFFFQFTHTLYIISFFGFFNFFFFWHNIEMRIVVFEKDISRDYIG